MSYPPDVAPLIEALVEAIRAALRETFVGACVTGSLALGGFDDKSDVDIVVATARPVSDAELAALKAIHDRVPPKRNEFGREYEVFYIDVETLRRWAPGQRHLRAEPTQPFQWETHRANFVLERWLLRERAITLAGPDPGSLVDAVSPDEMREAARREVLVRLDEWAGGQAMPSWLGHAGAQGYEIETMCRALYTIETGEICSKKAAVGWALEVLPEEWRDLIAWAWRHHKDDATHDTSRLPEAIAFVRYAAERATMSAE
ncbi:MAG: aminoglycoside adenylyltransferase domain-containing protein [Chloroflexota bacterium]